MSISKLSNLSLQLYSLLLKEGYVKNDEDSKKVTAYFEERLPDYQIDQLGFRGRLFLYKAYLWHSLILQDFVSSFKYAQKWVDLFEKHPQMKRQNPVFYLKGLNYLLESLYLIKHKTRFNNVLKILESDIEEGNIALNENTRTLTFLYINQHRLNLYFLEGRFTEGLSYVETLVAEIQLYSAKIDEHHIMVFYYKIACMYFGAGNNKACIAFVEKIIYNKDLRMREDLLCFSRVLNLVAHYEAGLDYHIEKLIVSTYKFLLKMNDFNQVQQKMIAFLKKLSGIYPQDLKKEFVNLHKALSQLDDHPYEKRAFLYLDILSWLESKIQLISVETIIQQKAEKMLK